MFNRKSNLKTKRVSLNVQIAAKSLRKSIKTVNKQAKFHLLCCKGKEDCLKLERPRVVKFASKMDTKHNLVKKELAVKPTAVTPSAKLTRKEIIESATNRLATSKQVSQSAKASIYTNRNAATQRLANNPQTPTTFKTPSTKFNTNISNRVHQSAVNTNARNYLTPTTKSVASQSRHQHQQQQPIRKAWTPQVNIKATPSTKPLPTANPTSEIPNSTKRRSILNSAKSSVRRSIRYLNNASSLIKDKNDFKTPTSNIRRNLFTNGSSRIPTLKGQNASDARVYPQTEVKKKIGQNLIEENVNRHVLKAKRRSSRFSCGGLGDIDSNCLIITPKLMRQLLSSASKSKPSTTNRIQEEEETRSEAKNKIDEEEEPMIQVHSIKPSSLLKYLFSSKENKLLSNDNLESQIKEEKDDETKQGKVLEIIPTLVNKQTESREVCANKESNVTEATEEVKIDNHKVEDDTKQSHDTNILVSEPQIESISENKIENSSILTESIQMNKSDSSVAQVEPNSEDKTDSSVAQVEPNSEDKADSSAAQFDLTPEDKIETSTSITAPVVSSFITSQNESSIKNQTNESEMSLLATTTTAEEFAISGIQKFQDSSSNNASEIPISEAQSKIESEELKDNCVQELHDQTEYVEYCQNQGTQVDDNLFEPIVEETNKENMNLINEKDEKPLIEEPPIVEQIVQVEASVEETQTKKKRRGPGKKAILAQQALNSDVNSPSMSSPSGGVLTRAQRARLNQQ